jgi:hypothetical protein
MNGPTADACALVNGPADARPSLTDNRSTNAQFVRYELCFSFIAVTIIRQSPPISVRSCWQRCLYGCSYSLLTLVLGPWGIPWGILATLRVLSINLGGGLRE